MLIEGAKQLSVGPPEQETTVLGPMITAQAAERLQAWDKLEVGGVVVGDMPSWRADAMPFGGMKDSGIGREGLRYATEEMTESRLLIIHG